MLRTFTRSIRMKLALVVLATTFVALLVSGVALVFYDTRAYRAAGAADLLTQAEILGRASAPALIFDDPKSAHEYLTLLRAKPEIAAAAIYNAPAGRSRPMPGTEGPGFPRLPETDGWRIEGAEFVLLSGSRRTTRSSAPCT